MGESWHEGLARARVLIVELHRHTVNMVTGRPEDGAYANYVIVPVGQAAILPDNISFTDGVVVPFAFVSAVHALSNKISAVAMPGVSTPALGLPFPSLQSTPIGKTLLVYGGSSSVGSMTIQLAKATGIHVGLTVSVFQLLEISVCACLFSIHEVY